MGSARLRLEEYQLARAAVLLHVPPFAGGRITVSPQPKLSLEEN